MTVPITLDLNNPVEKRIFEQYLTSTDKGRQILKQVNSKDKQ